MTLISQAQHDNRTSEFTLICYPKIQHYQKKGQPSEYSYIAF